MKGPVLPIAGTDPSSHLPSVVLAHNNETVVRAGKTQGCEFFFGRRDRPLRERPRATFRGRSHIPGTKSAQTEHLIVDESE